MHHSQESVIFPRGTVDVRFQIFDAFDSMNKMGYNLNISIAYLFDDQDLTRFIEDKVLNTKDNESPKKKNQTGQVENIEKIEYHHTEKEVR